MITEKNEKNGVNLIELRKKIFNKREAMRGTAAVIDYQPGMEVRLIVKENKRKPGKQIFAREDGKVGFPTINSIPVNIGDVIDGRVEVNNDSCFFIEIERVVQKAQGENK